MQNHFHAWNQQRLYWDIFLADLAISYRGFTNYSTSASYEVHPKS
ncbi:hypothetical protein [Nostoc sp. UCD121]|nr:hypothetical protein [Nostoc sp. UCD121]